MDFIKLEVLQDITNNYADDRRVGSGGYGVVYRATHDGQEIAVKRLHQLHGLNDKQFDSEFRNLLNIRHQNVVRLIGYCHESRNKYIEHKGELIRAKEMERVLCFEYMHGGSLDKHIQGNTTPSLPNYLSQEMIYLVIFLAVDTSIFVTSNSGWREY